MPLYSYLGQAPRLLAKERCFIAPGAHVIGKVELGEDVSLWFGSILRGDNEWICVGARTNIQERVIMHMDMGYPLHVGSDCTIGHGAILHGCSIGSTSLIGMGATLLNGVEVGKNCLVGANSLLTQGKKFPDGVLILGNPARIVRHLTSQEKEALLTSAQSYVEKSRSFQIGMEEVHSS